MTRCAEESWWLDHLKSTPSGVVQRYSAMSGVLLLGMDPMNRSPSDLVIFDSNYDGLAVGNRSNKTAIS